MVRDLSGSLHAQVTAHHIWESAPDALSEEMLAPANVSKGMCMKPRRRR